MKDQAIVLHDVVGLPRNFPKPVACQRVRGFPVDDSEQACESFEPDSRTNLEIKRAQVFHFAGVGMG